MGLFDFLKKKSEQQYYQNDSYYTKKSHAGTRFEKEVITFDKRKNISYPSQNGLYVAEILLLEYVSYGTYPKPKTGYPGFWWFEYGIRDIENVLTTLEKRGFIEYGSIKDSLHGQTVEQLKDILSKYGLDTKGKKADLLDNIKNNLSEEQLKEYAADRKYKLTRLGINELDANKYVPYMHKEPHKTIENSPYGPAYNVWSINKILKGDTTNWEAVVKKEYDKLNAFLQRDNK